MNIGYINMVDYSSELNIVIIKGLNILYSVSFDFFTNNSIETSETTQFNLSLIQYKHISNSLTKIKDYKDFLFKFDLSKKTINDYFFEFLLLLNRNNDSIERHFPKSYFQVGDMKKIKDLSKKYKLIVTSNNILDLLIDKVILSIFEVDKYFSFIHEESLKYEIVKSPKCYFILDTSIKRLMKYKDDGCWTCLICNYNLNYTDDIDYINEIILENCHLFEKINQLKKIYIDITSLSFYCQEYVFDLVSRLINDKNLFFNLNFKSNSELLSKRLFSTRPIHVLVITSVLSYPSFFNRSLLYVSNENTLYSFYICKSQLKLDQFENGLVSISLNKEKDFVIYNDVISYVNTYFNKNNIANQIEMVLSTINKDKLCHVMIDFSNFYSKQKTNSEFKLEIPNKINIRKDLLVKETIQNRIFSEITEKFNFEVVIKYSLQKDRSCLSYLPSHLENIIYFINKSTKWSDFITHINSDNELSKYNDLIISIEQFIPHKYIIKCYFLNGKTRIFIKQNKTTSKDNSNNVDFSLSYEMNEFLCDVMNVFNEKYDLNLFEIDFILRKNVFFLIDVCYFPSYEEEYDFSQIGNEFNSHFQKLYEKRIERKD